MGNIDNILILAGDTDHNLGDLAIVTATCDELRRINKDAKISLVTSMPERDCDRLRVAPIRRGLSGLPSLINAASKADLVICGGGGLFQDDNSLVKMPYWALRLAILRLFCSKIVGFSIGAGPLDHPVSRWSARFALKMLHSVSVRDENARELLKTITKKNISVVPDPAFMLQPPGLDTARETLRQANVPLDGTLLIGVAVRRWFHTDSDWVPHVVAAKFGMRRQRGKREMAVMIERCASSLDAVITAANAHVVFLPTYNVGHEDDVAVCDAIKAKMQSGRTSTLLLDDPKLYQSITAFLSVFFCGRLHPAILASRHGVPIVGLPYNPKFHGAFAFLPQSVPSIPISGFVNGSHERQLTDMLLKAISDGPVNGAKIRSLESPRNVTRNYLRSLLEPTRRSAPSTIAQHQQSD